MSKTIQISLDDIEGQLMAPPIVDSLHFEPSIMAYVVAFVPSEYVSSEPTESVTIRLDTPEGRRTRSRLNELARLLKLQQPEDLQRLVHGGGANFTFQIRGGRSLELAEDQLDSPVILRALNLLKDVAQAAEITFVLDSRSAA